jgi:hypothetical protein
LLGSNHARLGLLSLAVVILLYAPPSADAQVTVFAAVAPNARTTTIGNVVTAFATIVNAGANTATSCSISLPAGVPASLLYQTTDPVTNTPVGTPNAPVDIPSAQAQTFYFAITPTATLSQDIPLVFGCTNANAAPVVAGLTTLMTTAASSAIPDLLSIAETVTHDGNVVLAGTTGSGVMVTAAINIARAGTVTFRPTDTPPGQLPRNLPLNLSICQTDATGTCINPTIPGPSSTLTVANNQTVYFSVFAAGQGTLMPYDPANKRIFILATIPANNTNDGVLVLDPDAKLTIGAASAAVKMCVSDVNDLQSLSQNLSGNYCAGDNIVTNVGAGTGSAATWRVLSNGKVISSSSHSLGANASGDSGALTATAAVTAPSFGFLTDGAGGYLTDSNGERMTSD